MYSTTDHWQRYLNFHPTNIRDGIANDTLDEVESTYVHPNLVASVEGTEDIEVSDGIGS